MELSWRMMPIKVKLNIYFPTLPAYVPFMD